MKQDSILKFASAGITGLSTITGGGFKKACGGGTKKTKKSKKSKAKSCKSAKSSKSGKSNKGGCYCA